MVLPTKGNQWKTTGGSWGFLKSTCRNTLNTTDTLSRANRVIEPSTHIDWLEQCSQNLSMTTARRPMVVEIGGKGQDFSEREKQGIQELVYSALPRGHARTRNDSKQHPLSTADRGRQAAVTNRMGEKTRLTVEGGLTFWKSLVFSLFFP